jgi:Fur family zinc uptake transcriptional regulator
VTIGDRLALAQALCSERGARLTPLRRNVLKLLLESSGPIGAYQLVDALKRKVGSARPVAPPTVYRALDFLTTQGLVAKIESRNTYVSCTHPERNQDCIFLICSGCGTSAELDDGRIENRLVESAEQIGFLVKRRVIEVHGTCADCSATKSG